MSYRSPFDGRPPAQAASWPELLAAAERPEDVLRIAREFYATLDLSEVRSLPAECRPPAHFDGPEGLVAHAFTLVQADVGAERGNPALARMANFYSAAARRIAQLMSRHETQEASNCDDGADGPLPWSAMRREPGHGRGLSPGS